MQQKVKEFKVLIHVRLNVRHTVGEQTIQKDEITWYLENK